MDGFSTEFYQIFKEELIQFSPKYSIQYKEFNKNAFYETSITLIPKTGKSTSKNKTKEKKVIGQYP
jgi:hypothetical protein